MLAGALAFTPESSSIVVALYGEYGSGKTSTINICLEELAAMDEAPVVVRFEPGLYSTTGELYLRFFRHLGGALEGEAAIVGMKGQMVGYGCWRSNRFNGRRRGRYCAWEARLSCFGAGRARGRGTYGTLCI